MQVTCPHCSTRYVLPESLLGPHGARVRCPKCREPFAVTPDGQVAPPEDAPAAPASTEETAAVAASRTAPAANVPAESAPLRVEPVAAASGFASALHRVREALSGGAATTAATTAAEVPPAPSREAAPESPVEIARAVLGELAAHSGDAIATAQAEGRLFAEFGAVIAEAYEFYRRRIGSGAHPEPFRAALRERWGVDLEPGTSRTPGA